MSDRLINADDLVAWTKTAIADVVNTDDPEGPNFWAVDWGDLNEKIESLASRPWVRVEDAEDWEDEARVCVVRDGEVGNMRYMRQVRHYNKIAAVRAHKQITHVWKPLAQTPPTFGEEG